MFNIFDNTFFSLALENTRTDAAIEALRDAISEGKCSYKAAKAYIILDTKMFGYTYDKRKVKWARRYLKRHNVSFDSLRLIAAKAADEATDVWKMFEDAVLDSLPSALRRFW
jgi:hypothetical protein